jgi:hypothetical protein
VNSKTFRLQKAVVSLDQAQAARHYGRWPKHGNICTLPAPGYPNSAIHLGDSGGGVYYWDSNSQRYNLLGVNSWKTVEASATDVIIGGHEDLAVRYEELCYYLGLCMPGYDLYQLLERGVEDWAGSQRLFLDAVAMRKQSA